MDEESDDQEDREERRPRRGYPRFGSFFTIAVALLMLFGAASRFGKTPETAALFGMDNVANQRIRDEEARIQAALSLGARPAPMEDLRPQSGRLPVDQNAMPPPRAGVDLSGRTRPGGTNPGRSSVSLAVPEDLWNDNAPRDNGNPPVRPQAQATIRHPETYVVANGDNWNKIALKTLGDGKRWQEILNANPSAKDGLRVGMKLNIPN